MTIEDCQESEEIPHPDFIQLNPDQLEMDNNVKQVKRTFRNIEIKTADERLEEARQLDQFQKKALTVAVDFAVDIIISRKGKIPYPKAPFMMVHGGAGSGKSTLINFISQHVHHILRRDGDDPECPYTFECLYRSSCWIFVT